MAVVVAKRDDMLWRSLLTIVIQKLRKTNEVVLEENE